MAYYTRTYPFAEKTLARGTEIRAELDAISESINTLPVLDALLFGVVTTAGCSGLPNAYTLTGDSRITSLSNGLEVVFEPNYANTNEVVTVAFNGLGIKSLKTSYNGLLYPGDLVAGVPVVIRYSTVTGAFHLMSGQNMDYIEMAATSILNNTIAAAGSAATATVQVSLATAQVALATVQANAAAVSANDTLELYTALLNASLVVSPDVYAFTNFN